MELLLMDKDDPAPEVIHRARELLLAGGVLAYPTETLYGLGADARNEEAVNRVRKIKGRDMNSPIPVIAASVEMAREWAEFDHLAERLAQRFWPGPLTLILPLRRKSRKYLIGGASGLGIRVSGLASARALSSETGAPVTATSANRSGEDNLLSAREIESRLGGEIELILDGGKLDASPGSTLLDLTTGPPRVLREGIIPASDFSDLLNSR